MTTVSLDEVQINGETYVKKSNVKQPTEASYEYVVVRTYSAGVHAGYLKRREGKEVELTNCRRLWYWDGAASLSQVAGEGISKPENCKFPAAISSIILTEAIEIVPCTQKAKEIIEGIKVWKQ